MLKAKDLRQMSEEELVAKLRELRRELFQLRMDKALAKLEQPHRFKEVRRDIARILTVLREKGVKL